jgi:tape measure domain-containing protein
MQFDNKGFESGVRSTISSLEELKASLKFSNVTTGIEQMGSSIKNISFDNLTTGIEKTIVKIPVMGTVMDQTIRNMTNSVESFVKTTLDKFSSLGNAKTGFGEYELQIGAVKTIAASTGEDIKTINNYLEDLNKYADDTIYSFSDMTQNIGKFTNAGVKLDDAVNAIKGVANVAAVSGASTQEASRAMYNFAQALSQGSVKLIDWKSIENANMATVEFKNQLIETAVAMGTLVKDGNKYISTTTDLTGKVSTAFDATSMFNESLSHQWLTTDVLVKTLNNYTDTTTEIGQKATEAATKVNTFHQAMDAIVEGLGSSWAQSWQYIVGDFEDATAMWTKFKDAVEGLFKPTNDARNEMLKFWSTGSKEGQKTAEITEEAKQKYQDLFNVATKGVLGDFGNGEARMKALTEAGYDYAEVQNIINGIVDGSIKSWEDLAKAESNATDATIEGMTGREMALKGLNNLWETTQKIMSAISDAWHDVFPRTTGERLVEMSRVFMEFTEKIKISDETADKIKRTLRGLFAILDIGLTIIKAVIKGIGALFSGITSGMKKSDTSILDFTAKIGDLLFELDQIIKESGIFETVFVGIGKTIGFVGGTIISVISTIITGISDIINSIFNLQSSKIDTSSITDGFESASDSVSDFTKNIADKVESFATIPVSGITTFVDKVKNSFGIFGKVTSTFSKIADVFSMVVEKVKKAFQIVSAFLSPVVDLIKDKLSDLIGGTISFEDFIKFLKEGGGLILLGEFIALIRNIRKTLGNGESVGKSLSNMFNSIADSAKALTAKVKAAALMQIGIAIAFMVASVYFLAKMDPKELAIGLAAFTALMLELNKALEKMSVAEVVGSAGALFGLANAILLLTIAVEILGKTKPEDVMVGITFIGVMIFEVTKALQGLGKVQSDLERVGRTMMALAISIVLLTIPIEILGKSKKETVKQGLGFLTLILGELVGTIALFKEISTKLSGTLDKVSRVLVVLALTVSLLIPPLIILGMLPLNTLIQGALALAGILLALSVSMAVMGNIIIPDGMASTLLMLTAIIGVMATIVKKLGSLDQGAVVQGTVALFSIVGMIIVMTYVLGNVFKNVDMAGIVAVLLTMIVIIGIMAAIMLAFAKLNSSEMGVAVVGILGIAVGVAVLAVALSMVAKAFSKPGMITGANKFSQVMLSVGGSILMVGAGIWLLIDAFDKLNNLEFGDTFLNKVAIVGSALLLLVENLIGGIIGGIVMAGPAIANGALTIIDTVLAGLDENMDSIIDHVVNILHKVMDAIVEEGPILAEDILELILGVTTTLAENGDKIYQIVENVITIMCEIIDGLADNISELNDSIENLIGSIFLDLSERAYKLATEIWNILKRVWRIVKNFIQTKIIDPAINIGKKLAGAVVGGIIDGLNALIEGIVDGIHSLLEGLVAPINAIGEKVGMTIDIPNWDVPDIPKPGKIEEWQNLKLAKGGQYNPKNAIVGEAGPELLSSRAGKTVVTPLSNTNARSTTKEMMDRYTNGITKQLGNIEVALNQNRSDYKNTKYDDSDIRNEISSVKESIDYLREDMKNLKVVLDGKALVGQLVGPMDDALGTRAVRRRK